jgi:hypothetical protein
MVRAAVIYCPNRHHYYFVEMQIKVGVVKKEIYYIHFMYFAELVLQSVLGQILR